MKVSIIGCSCAGLGTALELLKLDSSIDVTLYDRKERVGDRTVCGGAISNFVLKEVNLKIPSSYVAAKVSCARIYAPNMDYWEIASKGRNGYVLWRAEFERYLAKKVMDLGAEIKLNTTIKDVRDVPGDVVVGADGLTGPSSRLVGIPEKHDIHFAVQRTATIREPNPAINLYFGNKTAPGGYAWMFPETDETVRIGLGVPLHLKVNPAQLLKKFMKRVKAEPVSKLEAKLLPTTKPLDRLVFWNVVLVGDAAHLCDPMTGGGIANAFISGQYAAKAIMEEKLASYDAMLRGLKRRNMLRYGVKKMLYDLTDQDYNDMFGVLNGFEPDFTRLSWGIIQIIVSLAARKPALVLKHKILRQITKTFIEK